MNKTVWPEKKYRNVLAFIFAFSILFSWVLFAAQHQFG